MIASYAAKTAAGVRSANSAAVLLERLSQNGTFVLHSRRIRNTGPAPSGDESLPCMCHSVPLLTSGRRRVGSHLRWPGKSWPTSVGVTGGPRRVHPISSPHVLCDASAQSPDRNAAYVVLVCKRPQQLIATTRKRRHAKRKLKAGNRHSCGIVHEIPPRVVR